MIYTILLGPARMMRAKDYQRKGRVNITKVNYKNADNFEIHSIVNGNYDDYEVYISVEDGEIDDVTCECEDYASYYGSCKHIVATMMEFCKSNNYASSSIKINEKYSNFKDLINT